MEDRFLGNVDGMVFADAGMKDVVDKAKRFAALDLPILLTGETGTGKEVMAQLIHKASGRQGQLVTINVASISEDLVESELFGHIKGAFTGANANKQGLLELAKGGTVFLDEIAEMSWPFQAKLLRVVDGEPPYRFRKVGSANEIASDFRIICASNRPLEKMIDEGDFMKDLFYRLQVFKLSLPPLRERHDDIVALVNFYLRKTCDRFRKKILAINKEALVGLINYSWPGNIRELMTVVARAVALCKDSISELGPEDFGLNSVFQKERINDYSAIDSGNIAMPPVEYGKFITNFKKRHKSMPKGELDKCKEFFLEIIKKNSGDKEKTASDLKIGLKTLYRYLKLVGISKENGY